MSIKSKLVSGKNCRSFIQELKLFHSSGTNHRHPKGSTLWSEQLNHNLYVVYSYGTHWPLLANWKGVWFSNEDKSTRTTNRHRTYTSPYVPTVEVSRYIMKDIIDRRCPAPELLVQAAILKLVPEHMISEVTSIRVGASA